MDPLAVVLLRRTSRVAVVGTGAAPADGAAWVAALEADLAERGWLLRDDLRTAAAGLPPAVRVRWADWLLASVDELVGADRRMIPLYRSFPDTPRDVEAVYVRRLLTHLFAVPGAPCVLCGREDGGAPLDPCGHLVCPSCFPPEQVSACPICGRRLAADNTYLAIVEPPAPRRLGRWRTIAPIETTPTLPMRLAGLEADPVGAAVRLRDQLVARAAALSEADRADLEVVVTATAPGRLDWLPEVVPARETLAVVIAGALHATALTPGYRDLVAAARARWSTTTDVARTLWAYSGGDPGLILPRQVDESHAPGASWRPSHHPVVTVPVSRVRALPRPLRRAALAHFDACGAAIAAEDLHRHPTIWKRLGERLHPYEKVAAHPAAAVAFAALRGTRTARASALGAAIEAACAREPRHLVLTVHSDDTVTVRLRSHASLVEAALAAGDVAGAVRLLTERPGELWRRLDHLLRAAGDDPAAHAAIETALRRTAARVAPGVLAAAAAQLAGRADTVRATAAQLAATARARAAAQARKSEQDIGATALASSLGAALRVAAQRLRGDTSVVPPEAPAPTDDVPTDDVPTDDVPTVATASPDGIVGGRPGPGMPRRVFFPGGSVVTTWTEPERRPPLPATAIATAREVVDGELTTRAARLDRFDVAVLDAALGEVPAPMRERAASAQLAGWPRGSARVLPDVEVLRLFLHWEEPRGTDVDLDLSCVFFDRDWQRVGHCDYTHLRFAEDGAVHSGDLTSAPAPLGATEFLDLRLAGLAEHGVHYVVPSVLSYNAVPFEALTEAIAGLMLPLGDGEQFDGARVAQRFDLRGNARMLMPMVLDLPSRRLLWTDLTLTGRGYGHSVARHGDQLARAAADQWEHFLGGHRATVLDLLAWHAAGRADRILVGHPDRTYTEVPADVAAVRAAASAGTGEIRELPDLTDRTVLVGAVDREALDRLVPSVGSSVPVGPGSTVVTVTGTPDDRWTVLRAGDLLAELDAAGRTGSAEQAMDVLGEWR
ncbi:MXAN_6230/SCO0854 family RING domain-containing protein [Micromonospora sp. CPCC 205539]|uniref:MXAN_6230/SCO0854 family RING domain-containing protein n=1 Tax=Micromonospora sp. CPCC 205539 TaxID=3122408 RepID=UPI002FF113E2